MDHTEQGKLGTYRSRTTLSMMANKRIRIGSNMYEKLKIFNYLGSLLTHLNSIHEGT